MHYDNPQALGSVTLKKLGLCEQCGKMRVAVTEHTGGLGVLHDALKTADYCSRVGWLIPRTSDKG